MSTAAVIPPIAPSTGSAIRRRSRNAPVSSSRLASRPTTRKKSVIRPWLIHSRRGSEMPCSPTITDRSVVQNDSYESDHGELDHASAASAAASRAIAPDDSVFRKSRTGAARLRAHAVRSVKARAIAPLVNAVQLVDDLEQVAAQIEVHRDEVHQVAPDAVALARACQERLVSVDDR